MDKKKIFLAVLIRQLQLAVIMFLVVYGLSCIPEKYGYMRFIAGLLFILFVMVYFGKTVSRSLFLADQYGDVYGAIFSSIYGACICGILTFIAFTLGRETHQDLSDPMFWKIVCVGGVFMLLETPYIAKLINR